MQWKTFLLVVAAVVSVLVVFLALLGPGGTGEQHTTPDEALSQAHYDSGHEDGYTDGANHMAEFLDNFSPPTQEGGRSMYAEGYYDGFLSGCAVAGYDCSQVRPEFE